MKLRHTVAIVGTGTEVGKTWLGVRLLQHARAQGITVCARKPAQSFEPGDTRTDAHQLAEASGEQPEQVCPPHRWYERPMAPPMAADALSRPTLALSELLAELRWREDASLMLVETAGGVRSPIAHDADNEQLVRALQPSRVVLVADAGLGTLNAVRLCVQALSGLHTVVFLNRYDPRLELHVRNRDWLVDRDQLTVCVDVERCSELVLSSRITSVR